MCFCFFLRFLKGHFRFYQLWVVLGVPFSIFSRETLISIHGSGYFSRMRGKWKTFLVLLSEILYFWPDYKAL